MRPASALESFWCFPVVSGCESSESGESDGELLKHAAFMAGDIVAPELTREDKEMLREVNRQADNIKTQIRSVVLGETNAFFIWGEGGHGKSYLVRSGLIACENVKWWTTDTSPAALCDLLSSFPAHIHVFEDMEKVFREPACQSILRAACGGESKGERWVHWEKKGVHGIPPFQFDGGVIIVGNESPTGHSLKFGAIASRFAPQEWKLTEQELAAVIRDIAINTPCKYGYSRSERIDVAEFVITEMKHRPKGVQVDLRTFCEHALPAYWQWKEGESLVHWHEVIKAKIQGRPKRSYAEIELERLLRAACEAYHSGDTKEQRVAVWKELAGLGRSQFYEYLKRAKESGMFESLSKAM